MRVEIYRFNNNRGVEFILFDDYTYDVDISSTVNIHPSANNYDLAKHRYWGFTGTENLLFIKGIGLFGGWDEDNSTNHSQNISDILLEREFLL